jgi:Rod binding domain-containing protein
MSSILPTEGIGTAPIDQSKLPADVRNAGPQAQQLYETALSFEQVLLGQLTQELQSSSSAIDGSSGDNGSDGSSSSSDSGDSMLMGMLPDAFAQGLTGAGGVGIARELYDSLAAQAGIQTTPKAAGQ